MCLRVSAGIPASSLLRTGAARRTKPAGAFFRGDFYGSPSFMDDQKYPHHVVVVARERRRQPKPVVVPLRHVRVVVENDPAGHSSPWEPASRNPGLASVPGSVSRQPATRLARCFHVGSHPTHPSWRRGGDVRAPGAPLERCSYSRALAITARARRIGGNLA